MKRRDVLRFGAAGGMAAFAGLSPLAAFAEGAEVKDMVLGDENAPVTFIEYASYTCPHCANFHKDVFKQLKADYIDTGKVKFVYREVYFDRPGLWAAMLARCAGESRYFGLSGMIYDKQKDWIGDGSSGQIAQNLRTLGKTAGMTDADIDACFANQEMAEGMIALYEANMKEFEIKGTPSFVINGTLHGNQSYDDIKALIEAEL